jgi:hypothetical protein
MSTITGVIQQMHESGKRFKMDDGNWYSAFAISQVPKGLGVGDTVGFVYTLVEKDDKTYRNIKGNVSKKEGAAPRASEAAPVSRSAPSTGGYSRGAFPVPALDGSRSIIRQNALTQANACVGHYLHHGLQLVSDEHSVEDLARKVIEVARIFEAYSAGDLDAKEAEAAMEEIRKMAMHTDSHK